MTSIEIQKDFTNSLHLQSSAVPESSQKEQTQLFDTPDKYISIAASSNKEESKTLIADIASNIKGTLNVTNCDQKKSENEEMIILENDKKEVKLNTDKIEDVQNTGELDVISSVVENDFKINKNESAKETAIKTGNNLKRKRRNFIIQETDSPLEENSPRSKRKKKNTNDRFCWRCHKESVEAHCSACPRSWHRRCIGMQQSIIQNWICGECAAILRAENAETRSTAMAQLSVDQLCLLLKHVVERMREYPGSEPFWKPVELSEAPNYLDYVVKPMDLSLLESNVRAKLYGSTDAFMADAKWIQHNCIVFNTCGGVYADTSKLTNAAKQIIKLARQEVSEIEACPDCYAHGRNLPRPQPSWFIEPCRRPHPLVWAKLKGFPFWPAKAMPRMNSQGFVDVRFFGEHDRAWVSPRDLYLYSEDPPVPLPRKRKLDMEECVREITRHCRKLELVFGQFKFAPPKVQYNPHDPMQIKLMLPNYDPLYSNNYISSQFLIPKKKQFFKKRLHVKTKAQSDSEKADNSDTDNKILTSFDTNTEQKKIENEPYKIKEPDKFNEVELITITGDGSNDHTNVNESVKKENKEHTQIDKNVVPTNLKAAKKEDVKPSTSKSNMNDVSESNTIKQDSNESNVILEQNNNSEKVMNDNTKAVECLTKQLVTSSNENSDDIQVPQQEPLLKSNVNKGDVNQTSLNSSKSSFKGTKSVVKVYKPKTRIVDKVNAEKALKSIAIEQNQKLSIVESTIGVKQNDLTSSKDSAKNANNNSLMLPAVSVPTNKSEVDINNDNKKNSTDQSVALLFVVNNGTSNTIKKSTNNLQAIEKEKNSDISVTQQSSKDSPQTSYQKKESKARKSFPNRARNCPQLIPHSSASVLSNSIDSMVCIPAHQAENCNEYRMLPPEAGPISTRLYHGAQNLARKMAQLMEEAYKEAAQENKNCESTTSENHQATIHFLRLQIERMRWEHQQQLAELKHNTDKILREMKASLEAERLRAIEETRREAEEEKLRCIEEIKRKQWCAMCGREALFYCCWNTAYCDYPCQQSHWPMHMRTCAQKPSFTTIVTSSTANSNQQQNHNVKVSSPAGRVYTLSHSKLNEISASLSFSYSKNEDNGTSS